MPPRRIPPVPGAAWHGYSPRSSRASSSSGAHLVAPVRSGARVENGVLVEREEAAAA
ncbi:hypothetical protein [Streptomyces sp. TLI_146]|uniref:hypothetical protein n=1 Tax=Streptomyces sp. TLI_146 TaxID=1938858 RepID=UPI000CB564A6|nr:hypothetical protein [Streptomyces sp. TLI_146]PKV82759.1 hypothetical protein BX283_0209 [Streptomyces sp. TLI_146]